MAAALTPAARFSAFVSVARAVPCAKDVMAIKETRRLFERVICRAKTLRWNPSGRTSVSPQFIQISQQGAGC